MTGIEVSVSRGFKGVRWAARIVSLLPGPAIILTICRDGYYLIRNGGTGEGFVWVINVSLFGGLAPLLIGIAAWTWPHVGGILLILVAAVFLLYSWAPDSDTLDPIFDFSLAAASFTGGILQLMASPWGRRLWRKEG